jgi:Ca2+-binding RTX toxin-like protein
VDIAARACIVLGTMILTTVLPSGAIADVQITAPSANTISVTPTSNGPSNLRITRDTNSGAYTVTEASQQATVTPGDANCNQGPTSQIVTCPDTGFSRLMIGLGGGDDGVRVDAPIDSTMFGGDGNDTLEGGGGRDTLRGQQGSDTVRGREGEDSLYGDDVSESDPGSGADRLEGGAGNDALNGGRGPDALLGAWVAIRSDRRSDRFPGVKSQAAVTRRPVERTCGRA